ANAKIIHDVKHYFLDDVIGDCNAQCLLRQVSKQLSRVGYSHTWHLFPVTSIEVLSSLSGRENSVADVHRNNEAFRSKVINTIKNGQHIIDLTVLAKIDDSWVGQLQGALKTIEENAQRNGTSPIVRIYVGLGGLATGWPDYVIDIVKRKLLGQGFISESGIPETQWNTHFQGILAKLVSRLTGNTNMQVYISGGRKSFFVPQEGLFDLTWNHSKIVAVDGIEAITGGHNLWEEYFAETPVIDTSVKIQGTAAYFTHKVVDKMWRTGDFRHMLKWQHGTIAQAETVPFVEQLLPLPPVISGDIDVLILDQGNPVTVDSADRFDMKTGVRAMISAAQQEVFLSQQSLINPFSQSAFGALLRDIDEELAYVLAKKSIEGVAVNVILSNPVAPFDTTSNASNTDIIKALWSAATDSGVTNDADSRQKFCSHFKLGNLRIDSQSETYPNTNYSFANHSKAIMIDKKLFSIGSHNVYEQRPASLIEMMYVIASEAEAEKYYRNYWSPLIANSQRTFVSKEQCVQTISS
ncbi:phospholipase D-like domain-containing protein, partial [Vibrio penaeicida]|uniref:phospholipase D-like domain-containing protein n=1 Tax=Vibrio penaeicida TaxID=104609 RepID=UPI0011AB7B0D